MIPPDSLPNYIARDARGKRRHRANDIGGYARNLYRSGIASKFKRVSAKEAVE
jgi:hypothetical protein